MKADYAPGAGGVGSLRLRPLFVPSIAVPSRSPRLFWIKSISRPLAPLLSLRGLLAPNSESVRRNSRKNPPSSAGPKGGSVCIKKHTGRRDIGASQKRGDRPALRAAAPTQRGLSSLQPSARTSRREGVPPKSTPTNNVTVIVAHSTSISRRPKTTCREWWNGA